MMAESFSHFDAAEYLRNDADVDAYLEAAEDDPAALVLALAAVARARNMSKLSRETGLSREGVYKALSPAGNPSFATVAKIAGALGPQISFRRVPVEADTNKPA